MKKLFILLFYFISFKVFGQYPVSNSLGSDSTLVTSKGATKSRFVNIPFTDTAQANNQRIKFYNGAQIFTYTGGAKFWIRDYTLNKWVQIGAGGGGGFATADNGLTANTSTNVQLGGRLNQSTTIYTGVGNQYSFELRDSSSSDSYLTFEKSLLRGRIYNNYGGGDGHLSEFSIDKDDIAFGAWNAFIAGGGTYSQIYSSASGGNSLFVRGDSSSLQKRISYTSNINGSLTANSLITKRYADSLAALSSTTYTIVTLKELNGFSLNYPVKVIDVQGNEIGQADDSSSYITVWNASKINKSKGVLAAGPDSVNFRLYQFPNFFETKNILYPNEIDSIVAWYDYTKANGVKIVGGLVDSTFDLSGKGNHLGSGGALQRPSYTYYGGLNGLPYMSTGNDADGYTYMSRGTLTGTYSSPQSVYMVARFDGWYSARRFFFHGGSSLLVSEDSTGSGNKLRIGIAGGYDASINPTQLKIGQFYLIKGKWSTGNLQNGYAQINDLGCQMESATSTSAIGGAAFTSILLCDYNKMSIHEVVVIADTLAPIKEQALKNYFYGKYVIPQTKMIISIGDSHTTATGISQDSSFTKKAADSLGYVQFNWGLPGEKIACTAGAPNTARQKMQYFASQFRFADSALMVWQYGTNDITIASTSDSTKLYDTLRLKFKEILEAGVKAEQIVICTPPWNSTYDNSFFTRHIKKIAKEFNIRRIADLYTITKNASGAGILQGDNLHLTALGHRIASYELVRAILMKPAYN